MILNRATATNLPILLELQVGAFGPDGELSHERRYEPSDFDDDLASWMVGERYVELHDGTIAEEDHAAMCEIVDEALSWVAAEHETATFSGGRPLLMQWDSTMDNTAWARQQSSSDVALLIDIEGRPHHERDGACLFCGEACSSCDCDPYIVATARLRVALPTT